MRLFFCASVLLLWHVGALYAQQPKISIDQNTTPEAVLKHAVVRNRLKLNFFSIAGAVYALHYERGINHWLSAEVNGGFTAGFPAWYEVFYGSGSEEPEPLDDVVFRGKGSGFHYLNDFRSTRIGFSLGGSIRFFPRLLKPFEEVKRYNNGLYLGLKVEYRLHRFAISDNFVTNGQSIAESWQTNQFLLLVGNNGGNKRGCADVSFGIGLQSRNVDFINAEYPPGSNTFNPKGARYWRDTYAPGLTPFIQFNMLFGRAL